MTVKVVTDSACDLPQDVVDELGITIVPLTVRFGSQEYVDRQDLTTAEFWEKCDRSPTLPETAAPAPGAFESAYRDAAAAGHDGVVVVTISGGVSATLQSAQVAADSVAGLVPVRIVDSRQVSGALGLIVLAAARLAANGKALDDVAGAAEDSAARTRLYATFDTLDNLRKGGRIGRAQALVGTMLSMKPVIELRGGVVEPESRQRTRAKSLRYLADKVREAGRIEHLALLHADAPDYEDLLVMLAEIVPREEILVAKVGAVIGTHAGPRAMAVAFQVAPSP
jgi:DegV family protein with EDD domain